MSDREHLLKLPPHQLRYLIWRRKWLNTARSNQIPPKDGWTELGMLAGRGFGKTLVGAEWLSDEAYKDPFKLPSAVIAPTLSDVRHTCFEGPTGILSIVPPELVFDYNKTNLIITLVDQKDPSKPGAIIRGFSAEEPERMRGPQFARLWCFVTGTAVSTPNGNTPIETLRPGDFVTTRGGPRKVLANSERRALVGEVTFSNGAKLVGTPEHPVYLRSGWTRLDQLKIGDRACVLDASNGAESVGTSTGTGQRPITSEQTKASNPRDCSDSIASFGEISTVLSPMDMTFTTRIIIKPITTPTTLSAYLGPNTIATICWLSQFLKKTGLLSLGKHWLALSAAQRCYEKKSPSARNAPTAIGSLRKSGERSSASAENVEAPLNLASATSAVSVASTWRPLGEQSVFCLKVEGEPEYFANGILVHNCDEVAAWTKDEDTWDMAMMGLRLGAHPQVLWTTTPKPRDLIRKLVEPKPNRIIVKGSTYENRANLPQSFFDQLVQYEGTQLGRQELDGELIDAEEGGIIARSWLRLWPAKTPLPVFDWIIMSLDTAFTERTLDKRTHTADSSACTVWGVFWHDDKTNVLLLDCWSEQLGLPDLIKKVKKELNTAYGDDQDRALIKPLIGSSKPVGSGRKPDILLIEDKGSGISLRQMLDREGISAYAYNPGRADKLTRLHMVSNIFVQKKVWVPESEKYAGRPRTWVEPMIAQLCSFTGSGSIKHDDYVDSTTQAIRLLSDKGLLTSVTREKQIEMDREREVRMPVVNPYGV